MHNPQELGCFFFRLVTGSMCAVDSANAMRLELINLNLPALLQRQIYLLPQFTPLTKMIAQTDICQARIVPARHTIKLTDNILQPQCLARSLRSPRLKLDMHNMDMKMVIRGLIMHIQ